MVGLADRKRALVLIPTTDGAIKILELKTYDNEEIKISQVVLQVNSLPQEENDITGRYHRFTSKSTPLIELLGRTPPVSKIKLNRLPEYGESWEVPISLAHFIKNQGWTVSEHDPSVVIWATGAIDADGNIRKIDQTYQIGRKLSKDKEFLENIASKTNLVVIVPAHEDFPDESRPDGVTILRANNLQDAATVVQESLEFPEILETKTYFKLPSWWHRGLAVALPTAAIGSIFAAAFLPVEEQPSSPHAEETGALISEASVGKSNGPLGIFELRPNPGLACYEEGYDLGKAVRTEVAQKTDAFLPTRFEGLCGFDFIATDPLQNFSVAFDPSVLELFVFPNEIGPQNPMTFPKEGGYRVLVKYEAPWRFDGPLENVMTIKEAKGPAIQISHRILPPGKDYP